MGEGGGEWGIAGVHGEVDRGVVREGGRERREGGGERKENGEGRGEGNRGRERGELSYRTACALPLGYNQTTTSPHRRVGERGGRVGERGGRVGERGGRVGERGRRMVKGGGKGTEGERGGS